MTTTPVSPIKLFRDQITKRVSEKYKDGDETALNIATKSKIDFTSFKANMPEGATQAETTGTFTVTVAYGSDEKKYQLTYDTGTVFIDSLEDSQAKPLAKLEGEKADHFLREFTMKDIKAAGEKKASKYYYKFGRPVPLGTADKVFYSYIVKGASGLEYALGKLDGQATNVITNVLETKSGENLDYQPSGLFPEAHPLKTAIGFSPRWDEKYIIVDHSGEICEKQVSPWEKEYWEKQGIS